jgi:hypothetical protein
MGNNSSSSWGPYSGSSSPVSDRIKENLDGSIRSNEKVQSIPSVYPDKCRRRISPQAGKALEKLGHAIEYLADEVVLEGGQLSGADPRNQAIQMLMALNRQIYFECPRVPTLRERVKAFLLRQTGKVSERLINDHDS